MHLENKNKLFCKIALYSQSKITLNKTKRPKMLNCFLSYINLIDNQVHLCQV